jgi:cardiolipin synthase (CMP-forming)
LYVKLKDLPNIISVLRLFAVAPVIYLLLSGGVRMGLVLFAVAGASDGLDGFLRNTTAGVRAWAGSWIRLPTRHCLVGCFLVLGWQGLVPVWLVLAVILRDVVIVTGALRLQLPCRGGRGRADADQQAQHRFCRSCLVVMVITDAGAFPLPDRLIEIDDLACFVTVVVSGAQYVWIWGRKARIRGWKER